MMFGRSTRFRPHGIAQGWRHPHLPPSLAASLLASLILLAGCTSGGTPATGITAPSASKPVLPDPGALSKYEIHVLPGGTEMELAGGMTDGTTDAIRRMLDATPKIKLIHLNSPGGQALEGYKLSLLIKERHLATYTSSTCASACTLAYIAGSPRYLAQGAWLGFHSSSRTLGGESWSVGNEAMRKIYRDGGLPEAFIDRALNTPPSDVWFPTQKELASAHVIDTVVDSSRFAQSGSVEWKNAADIDTALKANKFYAALASADPVNYQKLRDIFLAGAKAGKTLSQIEVSANDYVRKNLFATYVLRAPDEQLLIYQRSQEAEIDYLADHAPDVCASAVAPDPSAPKPSLGHSLPAQLQRDDMASLADLAYAALTHPRSNETVTEDHEALTQFMRQFFSTERERALILAAPQAHANDPAALCGAYRSFYHGLMDQPPAEAAAISRAILGAAS